MLYRWMEVHMSHIILLQINTLNGWHFADSLSSILYRVADKSGQTNVAFKFSKNLKAQSVRRDGFGSCKMDAGFGMCNSFFKFLFNFFFWGRLMIKWHGKSLWQTKKMKIFYYFSCKKRESLDVNACKMQIVMHMNRIRLQHEFA